MPPVRWCLSFLATVASGSIAGAQFPPSFDDAPLRAVHFVDKQEGWAAGDHGVVWHTTDGGKVWERQKSGTRASLRSICFLTPYTGFVAGRIEQPYGMVSGGVVLKTTDGGLTWQEVAAGILPGLNGVKFLDESKGVVVGDSCPAFPSGVFKTTDGGEKWEAVPEKQAQEQLPKLGLNLKPDRLIDLNRRTGQPIPIHAMQMYDATIGYAVGDLGTILATTDGGKSWQVRKCGGQRAAVLFIHATPDAVPLDTIVLLGAKDGYFCQVLSITGSEQAEKLHAAVRLCGGAGASVCTSFPYPRHLDGLSAEAVLNYWDTFHTGKAREQLIRQLVLAIRTWQPEVVVTDHIDSTASGMEQLVLLVTREAFTLAADPAAFPEQLKDQGLKPHQVKKFYGKCDTAKDATVTLDHSPFCVPLGNDVRDFCEAGVNLLGPTAAIPLQRQFRLVAHTMDRADKHKDLMEGVTLPRGGTARRAAVMGVLPEQYQEIRKGYAAARRAVEALTARPDQIAEPDKFLLEVRRSLAGMPEDLASRTAFAAADRLARDGRWGLAREMFAFVSDTFAAHPEAAAASRWLVQYHSSAAVLRRIELGQVNPIPAGVFEALDDVKPAGGAETPGPKELFRFTNGETQRVWYRYCLDLENRLVAFGPVHARDPLVRACVAAAKERGAVTTPTAKTDDRPVWNCPKAPKPTLDGKLTDECWAKAHTVPLAGPAGYDAEARLAHDDQYLYVAVTCKHPAGKQVPKVEKRDRDADLRGHDRVEWQIDPDGTGAVAFRFAVDHRGCLAEDCWGAKDWNPKWYVAFDSAETAWTAEVAIPLAELTGSKVAGQTWGLNFTRVVPGTGEPTTGWAKLTFAK
jgi:photosystem II stability/assembly factor-like uncharacterized protein